MGFGHPVIIFGDYPKPSTYASYLWDTTLGRRIRGRFGRCGADNLKNLHAMIADVGDVGALSGIHRNAHRPVERSLPFAGPAKAQFETSHAVQYLDCIVKTCDEYIASRIGRHARAFRIPQMELPPIAALQVQNLNPSIALIQHKQLTAAEGHVGRMLELHRPTAASPT